MDLPVHPSLQTPPQRQGGAARDPELLHPRLVSAPEWVIAAVFFVLAVGVATYLVATW